MAEAGTGATHATHTPEPWSVHEVHDSFGGLADEDEEVISRGVNGPDGVGINKGEEFELFSEADARRIVSCVNACAGMDDPEATIKAMRTALAGAVMHVPAGRAVEINDLLARSTPAAPTGDTP
ncbi:MAG: hypothetical protein AAFY08_13015 [Planctomycetota bacterium]